MNASGDTSLFAGVFRGARVLVTGHTGFKGSWLCEWLLALGAEVTGFALAPDTTPAVFTELGLTSRLRHFEADIRSADAVRRAVNDTDPDFVFHLAAQPLVRRSYRDAVYTWETNVLGTLHVLEALRYIEKPCAAVMVTTDKCYENREWLYGYREVDALGGHDPYSSSKAAAELAIASWRQSFFTEGHPVRVASARAGNVIGGGDWAEDRIIPDTIRALVRGEPIHVRNPTSARPWQHVLEPISGYMAIASALKVRSNDARLVSAFNIGPDHEANQTVSRLVETVLAHLPGTWTDGSAEHGVHEASILQLDNTKIKALIGWCPVWSFAEAVRRTVGWYRDIEAPNSSAVSRTHEDIHAYEAAARRLQIPWACPTESISSTASHA